MATKTGKSQFFGCLFIFFFVALTASGNGWAGSDAGLLGIQPSGYGMVKGESFFLLADSGFGAGETATIRLEGPAAALERYTGIDILLYRIPDPVGFLRKQPNLHRVQLPGRYDGEGLSNAVHYVWDVWYKKSRLAWQRIFSADARFSAVSQAPLLSQAPAYTYTTEFEDNPQFRPLSQFPLVSRFRYPLWEAEPIAPSASVKVEGSSHEFFKKRLGNVLLPLGKLQPGLYLVEGLLGRFRATALVFVSDTVAITKTSGQQMLVWTAHKKNGVPVPGVKLLLADGAGTLQELNTGADGTALFTRQSPERSHLIAMDPDGGVFVAENFYYDSEIHSAKLYAFTDRSLYRPGDLVQFKLVGRRFQDAQNSVSLEAGPISVVALDPNGAPVGSTTFHLDPVIGGNGSFRLPEQAPAGGYTLRMLYRDEPYAASFRVARYAKPHYDIEMTLDKPSYRTGEGIAGTIRATYPGGRPVSDLTLELNLRGQSLALSDYEQRQRGRFPIALAKKEWKTDAQGQVRFELPAAAEASRYTLRVAGSDGSSYRVSAVKELLIDSATPVFTLESDRQLTQPGESVRFTLRRRPSPEGAAVTWRAVCLEDQSRLEGSVQGDHIEVRFDKAGSYTVMLQDAQGHTLGTVAHWVGGAGLQGERGAIGILLDKERYRPGETVHGLITFPTPVQDALFTLERDQVHRLGTLSKGGDWLRLTRKSERQWAVEIPVTTLFQPNLTLSALMVADGAFIFQNKGIRVENDPVVMTLTPNKGRYQPGERVTVDLETSLANQPVSADLTVSVVDETVYLLQPELAPDIREFFGHLRRNQVRTHSSLQFHTYDQAVVSPDQESATFHRPLKLLERPRRENMDTALWLPHLRTGADGRGRFEFVLPDSITRWRITARATTTEGRFGQQIATLIAEKPAYLKWTAPTRFREGDTVQGMLLAFNMGHEPVQGRIRLQAGATVEERAVTLVPGSNPVPLPLTIRSDLSVEASLRIQDVEVDRLQVPITMLPMGWNVEGLLTVPLRGKTTPVNLPAGARAVRATLAGDGDAHWWRVAADLIDYPYGCAEQTASRLIPLTFAYRALRRQGTIPANRLEEMRDRVSNHRFRLAQMAGPEAVFGWWGDQGRGSVFFSAYAYYADHLALSALGLAVGGDHWMKLLDIYRKSAESESPLLRTLALWLAGEMKLPVQTMATGVAQEWLDKPEPRAGKGLSKAGLVLGDDGTPEARDFALVLLNGMVNGQKRLLPALSGAAQEAEKRLAAKGSLLSQAAVLMAQGQRDRKLVKPEKVAELLQQTVATSATIDRALTLIFLDRLTGGSGVPPVAPTLSSPWIRQERLPGVVSWVLPASSVANPVEVPIATGEQTGWTAYLGFEAPAPDKPTASMAITRRLWRLTPAKERPAPDYSEDNPVETLFEASAVTPDQPLESAAIYLDEVTLDPGKGHFRYGLLEVPLPPGGEMEPFTWGMAVAGLNDAEQPVMLTETHAEKRDEHYIVPIPKLGAGGESGVVTLRHLLRFPVYGTMRLPPVRYFSMYNPAEWAMGRAGLRLTVP
ncbi:MAG: alpha-2-macroglobulin family protein [Magnetococcales bacterium]|nr:alpha-2-macroglobulin family protein [Magnetococcales bacterium]